MIIITQSALGASFKASGVRTSRSAQTQSHCSTALGRASALAQAGPRIYCPEILGPEILGPGSTDPWVLGFIVINPWSGTVALAGDLAGP